MTSLMINPVISPIPNLPVPKLPLPLIINNLLWIVFISVSIIIAAIMAIHAKNKWHRNVITAFLPLSGIMAVLLLCVFGISLTAIKGMLLFFILLYAAYSDLRSRIVDDYVPIMIAVTAFTGIEIHNLVPMCFGAVVLGAPLILVSMSKPDKPAGGADIKLCIACGFLLGIERGTGGLIAGLLAAIISTLLYQKIKNKHAEPFPLVPYLAAGFMAAFFI
jgi:prepilin signal peptidase PulO-like enzyme (type II secretory pathway)